MWPCQSAVSKGKGLTFIYHHTSQCLTHMMLITHHNCPQFILRNGLITGEVPVHWGAPRQDTKTPKHFPLHGTDKGFLTTEEINVPDEDSNTAACEIAPSEQFGISTLTIINMPSWWLSNWWKTVFTIKATDTDWEAIYGLPAIFIVFHVSGFTSTLDPDKS